MSYTRNEILYQLAIARYTDDNGDYLRCLDASEHKNCKEFMLKVVEKELKGNWHLNSLLYASKKLKNDVDFLLQVAKLIKSVKSHTTEAYELLEYAEPSQKTITKITNCKKTLIQFLELGVPLLDKAPQKFLDDKDVYLAFKDNIEKFEMATPDIKLKALECLYQNRK